MPSRSGANLGVNIYAETAQLRAGVRELQGSVDQMAGSLDRLQGAADGPARSMAEAQRTAENMGRGFLVAGGAILAGFAMSTKAAMDWELAFADVVKTVSASDKELALLEDDLRGLARTIPVAHDELARIASIAGQLGLQANEIAKFTEVTANMAVATTLTADEAAFALARLSNIMGLDMNQSVENLADTIVHLGNNMATTETEIVSMAQNFASAGKLAGLSTEDILALSASLSAVGIHAEAGGTALGRFVIEMDSAVRSGGEDLESFAEVAGVSAEEFATSFREEPTEAIQLFVEGLSRISDSGGDVAGALQDLGLNEIRVRRALLSMAGNTDLLADALGFANEGWDDSNALLEEVSRRYDTANLSIETAWNNIKDAAIGIGQDFVPIVAKAARQVQIWGRAWASLDEDTKDTTASVAGSAGAMLTVTGAAIAGAPMIDNFKKSMINLRTAGSGPLLRGLGSLGTFLMGPWGVAVGAAIAVGLLWLNQKAEQISREQEWGNVLKETKGVMDESNAEQALMVLQTEGVVDAFKDAGFAAESLADGVSDGEEGWRNLGNQIGIVDEALGDMTATDFQALRQQGARLTVTEQTADALRQLGFEIGTNRELTEDQVNNINNAIDAFQEQDSSIRGAKENQELLNQVNEEAEEPVKTLTEAVEDNNTATERAVELAKEMTDQTLSMLGLEAEVEGAFAEATEAMEERAGTLDVSTESGRENLRMVDGLVGSINDEVEALFEVDGASKDTIARQEELEERLRTNMEQWGFTEEEIDNAVGALVDFSSEAETANPHIETLRSHIENFGNTTGLTTDQVQDLAEENGNLIAEAQELQENFEETGGSVEVLEGRMGSLREEFINNMRQAGYTEEASTQMFDSMMRGEELDETTAAVERLNEVLGLTDSQLDSVESQARLFGQQMGLNDEQAGDLASSLRDATADLDELSRQVGNGEISMGSYESQVGDVEGQLREAGAQLGLTDEQLDIFTQDVIDGKDPVDALRDATRELTGAYGNNEVEAGILEDATHDLGIETGNMEGSFKDLADQTRDTRKDAKDLWQSYQDGEIDTDELNDASRDLEDQFVEQARQMGINEDDARDLWRAYLEGDGIEVSMDVSVDAEGNVDIGDAPSFFRRFPGAATGGEIQGPGTGISDSVLYRLSAGEHVWTAAEVQAAGGHERVELLRQAIKQGGMRSIPGMRTGGAVEPQTWFFPRGGKYNNLPNFPSAGDNKATTNLKPDHLIAAGFEHGIDSVKQQIEFMRMQAMGGMGMMPFGSFTYNGVPADLPGLRGTQPHVRTIGNFIAAMFGITTAWGMGGPPEHSTGRAIDYMVGLGSGQSRGDGIAAYYLKHAQQLALQWIIWRQRIFNAQKGGGWRQMGDRGNPTQNHFDHPHVMHKSGAPAGLRQFIGNQSGVKFSDAEAPSGAARGSGRTVFTSFWDDFQPMANGRRMHGKALASSYIPMGSRIRVVINGKSEVGTVDDLGPAKFVYDRWRGRPVIDIAEPMMQRLTGSRVNTTFGSHELLSVGRGRTLFGQDLRGYDSGSSSAATNQGPGGRTGRVSDSGGMLGPGVWGVNLSPNEERVLSPRQTVAFEKLVETLSEGILGQVIIQQTGIPGFSDINEVRRAGEAANRARGVGRRK